MIAAPDAMMRVTIEDRSMMLRERLRDRLDRAAQLLCDEHGQPVVSVTIYNRENGWFDSQWTTCCERLERKAAGIVRERC